jgi:hypothetical protein
MNALLVLATIVFVPQGVDLNEELRKEIREGHFALAEKLLANTGVNPDSQDAEGWTPSCTRHSGDPHLLSFS